MACIALVSPCSASVGRVRRRRSSGRSLRAVRSRLRWRSARRRGSRSRPSALERLGRPPRTASGAARTTSSAPSTIVDSRLASASRPIGAVSTITQSKRAAPSCRISPMRAEVRPLIGSGSGRPAGSSVSVSVILQHGELARRCGALRPSFRPGDVRDAEDVVQRRPAQVGVDEQHLAPVRLAQRQRQVGRRSASCRRPGWRW